MKKILLIFSIVIYSISSHCQDPLKNQSAMCSAEFGIGASYLSDESIMAQNRQWGISGSLRLRIELKNRKFAFSPMIGFRDYQIAVEKEDFDNVLLAIRSGVIIDYNLYMNPDNEFFISNFIELCYSGYRDFLRQESGTKSVYTSTGTHQQPDYNTKTLYRRKCTFNSIWI